MTREVIVIELNYSKVKLDSQEKHFHSIY